ncbi:MAG: DNA polymerase III subunit beta [Pseudomonadales bacterium]|nr:DNA polymerase III subunit beta [Pseudomonadales bacterium]MCP5216355.1 DNA polymerase III subunit beta [Pseudomonadales bacterium]
MKFTISREALLKPLALVAGVVERRQTLPVLSNILMVVDGDQLSLTGTDLEVELVGRVALSEPGEAGEITVPARKMMDICKTLPDESVITIEQDGDKLSIRSGRSRFTLSTLPAMDFPNVEEKPQSLGFTIPQELLRHLIECTSVAMAQQDVRYYLNGMLFEIQKGGLKAVATDGHRLALCSATADISTADTHQVIVPRKGILELSRLLSDGEQSVEISMSNNHIRAITKDFTFTSKLVDGKFPDYSQVIPKDGNKTFIADREEFKQVLGRAAILSNEKYRGVRLMLQKDLLQVYANNPEQEEAEEEMSVDFDGDRLEIGFNVGYLLDVLSVTNSEKVKMTLSDANSSALIGEQKDNPDSIYVVMPMRL